MTNCNWTEFLLVPPRFTVNKHAEAETILLSWLFILYSRFILYFNVILELYCLVSWIWIYSKFKIFNFLIRQRLVVVEKLP